MLRSTQPHESPCVCLQAELASKEAELTALKATTPQALWLRDLDALEVCSSGVRGRDCDS